MLNYFKNITNSKLLVIAILLAFLAFLFDIKLLSFMQNESIFMFLRLVSFALFMFVAIKVINAKTKKTTRKKNK